MLSFISGVELIIAGLPSRAKIGGISTPSSSLTLIAGLPDSSTSGVMTPTSSLIVTLSYLVINEDVPSGIAKTSISRAPDSSLTLSASVLCTLLRLFSL